jgi:cytochrome oxidase assembly protein ShyY1
VRSFRFLLGRRWVLLGLVVALLASLAWWLGEWQFGRLDERRDRNATIERNEEAPPAPVAEVLSVDAAPAAGEEWRTVTATGTYRPEETVVVRYRTRDGAPGVDVVVPLETTSGPVLLVDRGWLGTDNAGATDVEVPAPPSGEVTVTGWVRADAEGTGTQVTDGSTRAISSAQIGPLVDGEVYTGFVDLAGEDPEPAEPLARAELPDLGEGPHFFYGLQWWFFGLLALVGFGYLAWDEWRRPGGRGRRPARDGGERPQSARSMPPSTGSMAPETYDAAGESRKAATRPNSAGSP